MKDGVAVRRVVRIDDEANRGLDLAGEDVPIVGQLDEIGSCQRTLGTFGGSHGLFRHGPIVARPFDEWPFAEIV